MNLGYQRAEGLAAQDLPVNVAAMAAIVQELVKRNNSTPWDTSELRERAITAGLSEHEYGAIVALRSKIETEGSAFLDPFFTAGW